MLGFNINNLAISSNYGLYLTHGYNSGWFEYLYALADLASIVSSPIDMHRLTVSLTAMTGFTIKDLTSLV